MGSWGKTICLEKGKVMFMFIKYKKYENWHEKLLTSTHFLGKSSWVSWNIMPSVQQFKWHWMNPWWWLKKGAEVCWDKDLSTPLHFNIPTSIYLCTSFNFKLSFAFEFRQYCKLWDIEDIFSTAHTILSDCLRMRCIRASDPVWNGMSGDD